MHRTTLFTTGINDPINAPMCRTSSKNTSPEVMRSRSSAAMNCSISLGWRGRHIAQAMETK